MVLPMAPSIEPSLVLWMLMVVGLSMITKYRTPKEILGQDMAVRIAACLQDTQEY